MNLCLEFFLFLSIVAASAADSLLHNDTQAGQLNNTEKAELNTNSSFSIVVVDSPVVPVNLSNASNLENEANITTKSLIATNFLLLNQSGVGVEEEIDSPGVVDKVKDIISSSFNTVSHWALAIVGKVKRVVEESEQSPYNSSLVNNQSLDIIQPFDSFTANSTGIQVNISNSTNVVSCNGSLKRGMYYQRKSSSTPSGLAESPMPQMEQKTIQFIASSRMDLCRVDEIFFSKLVTRKNWHRCSKKLIWNKMKKMK